MAYNKELLVTGFIQELGNRNEFVNPPCKKFSKETRKHLESDGFLIYELNGETISSLRRAGKKFESLWHRESGYRHFESVPCIHSQVAFHPDVFFMAENYEDGFSSNQAKQEELVKLMCQLVIDRVPGRKLDYIIGTGQDYISLAWQHFDRTGKSLFPDVVLDGNVPTRKDRYVKIATPFPRGYAFHCPIEKNKAMFAHSHQQDRLHLFGY